VKQLLIISFVFYRQVLGDNCHPLKPGIHVEARLENTCFSQELVPVIGISEIEMRGISLLQMRKSLQQISCSARDFIDSAINAHRLKFLLIIK